MLCGSWRSRRRQPEEPLVPAQVATPVGLASPPASQEGNIKRPGLRALKKMGLSEDEDVRAMLRGSRFCKIRSPTWQKERLYRLQEDGLSVWFQRRIPRAPSQHIFFVQHIEAIREGHQSEGLRHFGGAFEPARCLTIAFKGRRKNLDLVAPTAEEAQRWVRGLAKLRARLDAMSQRERLDHWIHSYLHRADSNQDSKMSFKEIKNLLRMVNLDMNDMYAYGLFKGSHGARLGAWAQSSFLTLRQSPGSEDLGLMGTRVSTPPPLWHLAPPHVTMYTLRVGGAHRGGLCIHGPVGARGLCDPEGQEGHGTCTPGRTAPRGLHHVHSQRCVAR